MKFYDNKKYDIREICRCHKKEALKNGMNLIIGEVPQNFKENELFISEGGAVKEASFGIEILANEIKYWAKDPGAVSGGSVGLA